MDPRITKYTNDDNSDESKSTMVMLNTECNSQCFTQLHIKPTWLNGRSDTEEMKKPAAEQNENRVIRPAEYQQNTLKRTE